MESIRKKIERYLDGEASRSDLQGVRRWFEKDPSLGQWLREEVEQSDPCIDPEVDARMRTAIAEAMDCSGKDVQPARVSVVRRVLDIAAVVAVVFSVAAVFFTRPVEGPDDPLIVTTGMGEHSKVTLPDGTRVALNAMSQISYRFDQTTGTRHVAMNGEAYFDVAHDPSHPFIVKADDVNVECRGTAFDVKAYENDKNISVVLNEGEVVVSDAVTSISMKADMMVNYERHGRKFTSQRVFADDYNEWVRGTMRFNNERLEDIVKILARNYSMRINIVDPELRNERFMGNVGNGNLNDRLRILTMAANAAYKFEGDSVCYIYSKH